MSIQSGQGLAAYDSGAKKHWRNWQWNRIVERLGVPVADATVLYLSGPDDFDRAAALSRGFRNENLIAVDLSDANIANIRSGGGLGICHDLNELVVSWPADWPIDVIVADFCAGIQLGTLRLIHSLVFGPATTKPKQGAVVVSVNLQRGRDPGGKFWREVGRSVDEIPIGAFVAERDREIQELTSGLYRVDQSATVEKIEAWRTSRRFSAAKHRGMHFFFAALTGGALLLMREDCGETGLEVIKELVPIMDPIVDTYTSTKRTYFDTVVFRWPGVLWSGGQLAAPQPHPAARRKIAACRALRTQMVRRAA